MKISVYIFFLWLDAKSKISLSLNISKYRVYLFTHAVFYYEAYLSLFSLHTGIKFTFALLVGVQFLMGITALDRIMEHDAKLGSAGTCRRGALGGQAPALVPN